VASNYDRNAPFKDFKTYSWVTQPEVVTGKATAESIAWAAQRSNFLDTAIRAAFDEQLAAKGFSVDNENPDLHAIYHIGTDNILKVSDWGYDYVAMYGAWEGNDAEDPVYARFKTGDLILDLVNVHSSRLIWRGSVSRAITKDADLQAVETSIREAATKMLAPYPPQPRKRY